MLRGSMLRRNPLSHCYLNCSTTYHSIARPSFTLCDVRLHKPHDLCVYIQPVRPPHAPCCCLIRYALRMHAWKYDLSFCEMVRTLAGHPSGIKGIGDWRFKDLRAVCVEGAVICCADLFGLRPNYVMYGKATRCVSRRSTESKFEEV